MGLLAPTVVVLQLLIEIDFGQSVWSYVCRTKNPPLNCCQSSEGIHQGRSMNSIIRVRWSVLSTMPVCLLRRFPIHSYCSYPFQATYDHSCNERHEHHCDTHLVEYVTPVHHCLSPGFRGSFNSLILALIRHLLRLHCITKLRVTTNRVVAHQM